MDRLRKKSMYRRMLTVLASMVLAMSAMGLVFLAPIALIKYSKKAKVYEAKAEMPAPADKVYSTAVSGAEEKAPKIKIVKKEDKDMFLEVTDDIQTASVKVKAINAEKSEITVIADVPSKEGLPKEEEKKMEKELALRVIDLLCTKLEVECTISKE